MSSENRSCAADQNVAEEADAYGKCQTKIALYAANQNVAEEADAYERCQAKIALYALMHAEDAK